MTPDEAKKLWLETPKPLHSKKLDNKYISGFFEGAGPDDGIPQFNTSKGGRVWCEVYLTKELLEALITIGREQIPAVVEGQRWYRTDHSSDEEQPIDFSPMTPAEAFIVLEAKPNGFFAPRVPLPTTEEVLVMGENVIEEMEAYLLLWNFATNPQNHQKET